MFARFHLFHSVIIAETWCHHFQYMQAALLNKLVFFLHMINSFILIYEMARETLIAYDKEKVQLEDKLEAI